MGDISSQFHTHRRATHSALADLLEARTREVARRFAERLRETIAASSLSVQDVEDSVDAFLWELAAKLREGEPGRGDHHDVGSASASKHGEQRFALGYELGAVIREYGALRETIFDLVDEMDVETTSSDLRIVARHFISGISDAATHYASRRDEEVRAQTARHVAFLTHELRTPLSGAVLALALGKERGEIVESRSLRHAQKALARLQQLIDNTLVEIRLHDLAPLDTQVIDVGRFLRESLHELEIEAEVKGIALRLEVHGHIVIDADSKVLHAAISNLVRNGVKFSRAHGEIVVRAKDGDGRLVIEVEDACGGLPEGTVQKLFDPFVQAGVDRSGFGLGLAIVKRAANAHGGEVRVHDLPSKGCVFVLDLPLRRT